MSPKRYLTRIEDLCLIWFPVWDHCPTHDFKGQKNHSRKADQLGKPELTLPMSIVHKYMYSYALAGEFSWLSKRYIVTYVKTVELPIVLHSYVATY